MKKVLSAIMIFFIFPNAVFADNLWASDFGNDYGDYLYFDSSEVNNLKRTYNNFTCSDNENYIELSRLDYQNKDRTDYIYMEKSADDECWINIDIKKNYRARSSKTYNYFLLEADIKSEVKGAKTFIFSLNGTTPILQMHTDGYLYSKGVKLGKSVIGTDWVNVKAAVDVSKMTADIYINDILAQSITMVTMKTPTLESVKTDMVQGNGNFYIDNYRITGLDNSFSLDNEIKSSIFGDYSNEKAFMEGKVGFSRYSDYYYSKSKNKLCEKTLYQNGALYAFEDDFNAAFGTNVFYNATDKKVEFGEYTVDISGNLYRSGAKIKTLEKSFVVSDSKVYYPISEFAENLLFKKTAYDEKCGLLIISDGDVSISNDNWNYFSMRDSSVRITLLNNLDLLNNFIMYERPTAEKLKSDAEKTLVSLDVHPRIMINSEKISQIKQNAQNDADFKILYDRFMKKAEGKLKESVTQYKFADNIRMANLSAANIMYLGLAWNLTGDERFLEKGWLELKSVAEFPDYNLASIINSGISNELLAIGYDWLYNGLNAERREFIENTLLNKALKPLADGYYGRIFARGDDWSTLKWASNMNAVANAGAITSAAALFDKYPDYCFDVISKAIQSLEYTMIMYAPEGAWNEGLWYWHYCASFLGVGMLTLKSVFSSVYGLDRAQGFDKTPYAAMALIGPCGINNFGDAEFENVTSYNSFGLIAECLGDGFLEAVRVKSLLADTSLSVLATDVITYKKTSAAVYPKEKSVKISGGEIFTVRNDDYEPNSEKLYFSTHFGPSSGYHQHIDTGTFVYDILGERWAEDLGWEDYKIQNTYGYPASDIYRMRAEGHNVLIINPSKDAGQKTKCFVPVESYASGEKSAFAYADLTELYQDAQSVKLGYYIGDNMQSVTARYEIDLNKTSEMYWFMHTKADINVDGNIAYLTKNGKTVTISFLAENADASLSKMKAEPLETSPQIPEQNKNAEYGKVAIKLTGSGKITLTIKIAPLSESISVTDIKNESLTNWKIE